MLILVLLLLYIQVNNALLYIQHGTDYNEMFGGTCKQFKTLNNYLYDGKKFNVFFNTTNINKNYEFYHINDNIDYYYDYTNIKNKIIDIKQNLDKYSYQNYNISLILLINKDNITINNFKNIIHKRMKEIFFFDNNIEPSILYKKILFSNQELFLPFNNYVIKKIQLINFLKSLFLNFNATKNLLDLLDWNYFSLHKNLVGHKNNIKTI